MKLAHYNVDLLYVHNVFCMSKRKYMYVGIYQNDITSLRIHYNLGQTASIIIRNKTIDLSV